MKINGWGIGSSTETMMEDLNDETSKLQKLRGNIICRGNGRSYGDASFGEAITVSSLKNNKIIKFDVITGIIRVDSGLLLSDLIESVLPQGWFPPVVPGTKFVTIGGMTAANVHGKNHHNSGCFGNFVIQMKLIDANGNSVECSRQKNKELFLYTLGGMGLSGTITEIEFKLRKVGSGYIKSKAVKCGSLSDTIETIINHESWEYSAAWIDSSATGTKLGRSILFLGEHSSEPASSMFRNKASKERLMRRKKSSFKIPTISSFPIINSTTSIILNSLYYNSKPDIKIVDEMHWDDFFFPLDGITNWNMLYGSTGLIQFQTVLPLENAQHCIEKILLETQKFKEVSFLSVLKRTGNDDSSYLAFPFNGFTLTLDFRKTKNSVRLVKSLYKLSADMGGRFYLAKDSCIDRDIWHRSDARWQKYTRWRKDSGANQAFSSKLSRRLEI